MIRFLDGFNHYVTADLPKKWDTVDPTHVITTGGRFSANALSASGSQGTQGTRKAVLSQNNDEGIVGFHTSYPTISTAALGYFRQIQVLNGTTPVLTFVIRDSANGNGTMRVMRGDHDGTVLGTTSAAVVETAVQHHLELRWRIHETEGEIEIRVDGGIALLLSGVNTAGSSSWNTIALFPNVDEKISHLYVLDRTGARLNYFLGPSRRILTTFPNGTHTGNWTPSSGTRHAALDDAAPNGDTDYVYSRAAPMQDLYEFTDLSDFPIVDSLQLNMTARKVSAAHPASVAGVIAVSGGIPSMFGANHQPTLTYIDYLEIFDENDVTDAPWTIAEINAAQFGIRRSI